MNIYLNFIMSNKCMKHCIFVILTKIILLVGIYQFTFIFCYLSCLIALTSYDIPFKTTFICLLQKWQALSINPPCMNDSTQKKYKQQ